MEKIAENESDNKIKSKLERVLSTDGSCAVSDTDLKFIAMNSNLSVKEVRHHFADLSHGNIDKESFKKFVGLCYPEISRFIFNYIFIHD